MLVRTEINSSIASFVLNDPARRNALSVAMFDEFDRAIAKLDADEALHVVVVSGEGSIFCAGFDLNAAVDDPALVHTLIMRLSATTRRLRRLPQVVIAAVQGAAIAGGCALISACDFVIAAPDAKFGYPVHRIGISPAVTIPTLQQRIGSGATHELLMSGELIDATHAHRIGLVTHLARSAESLADESQAFAEQLCRKGTHALRVTKAWLNELDGSLDDVAFDQPAAASASASLGDEAKVMLQSWRRTRQS